MSGTGSYVLRGISVLCKPELDLKRVRIPCIVQGIRITDADSKKRVRKLFKEEAETAMDTA
jgi:hypothetical protein